MEEKRKYIANLFVPEEKRDHEVKQSSTPRYLTNEIAIDSVKQVLGNDHLFIPDCEADVDVACLAIHHQCPVLSNDSDFYIFPLLYGYILCSKFYWSTNDAKGNAIYMGISIITSCSVSSLEFMMNHC